MVVSCVTWFFFLEPGNCLAWPGKKTPCPETNWRSLWHTCYDGRSIDIWVARCELVSCLLSTCDHCAIQVMCINSNDLSLLKWHTLPSTLLQLLWWEWITPCVPVNHYLTISISNFYSVLKYCIVSCKYCIVGNLQAAS